VPADDVYKMLKIIDAHARSSPTDPTFAQIAGDMAGFSAAEAAADLVPIHGACRQ
jgi:hypothetical protein